MRDFVRFMLRSTRRWWEQRLSTRDLTRTWEILQQSFFHNVTKPVPNDYWYTGSVGGHDKKAGNPGEGAPVSKEYAATQIAKVLQSREKFLRKNCLPAHHLMNDLERAAFIQTTKTDFHSQPEQRVLQIQDEQDVRGWDKKWLEQRMRSRLQRHKQTLAGSPTSWSFLSFCGFCPVLFTEAELKANMLMNDTVESHRNTTLVANAPKPPARPPPLALILADLYRRLSEPDA